MNELSKALNGIYGWAGDKHPDQHLPQFVYDRINWINKWGRDESFTFMGSLKMVMAYEDDKEVADMAEDERWLPVTPEFKAWRDTYMCAMREIQVAIELIYAKPSKSKQ